MNKNCLSPTRINNQSLNYKIFILPYIITLSVLLLIISFNYFYIADAADDDEPYSIFILAGQSNAAGVDAYRSDLDDDGIFAYNHPGDESTSFWWAGANGKGGDQAQLAAIFNNYNESGEMGWNYSGDALPTAPGSQRLLNNINGYQSTGVFGSEFGIARTLHDMGRRKVIILKVSFGFQSMKSTSSPLIPFDWNVDSVTTNPDKPKSYLQLKNELQRLTTYLKSQNKKYTVDGIFWMQGETDMLDANFANDYQNGFQKLVDNAKVDLGLNEQGHFVIGMSDMSYCIDRGFPPEGNFCAYPWNISIVPFVLHFQPILEGSYDFFIKGDMSMRQRIVQNAQQAVSDSDSNARRKVDLLVTNDLPRGYDMTHLTAKGQIELGRRFVTMYDLPYRLEGSNDYDSDGILNKDEDTGRGASCPLQKNNITIVTAGNGNLGDDDSDCDGIPDYLDSVNGPGGGIY